MKAPVALACALVALLVLPAAAAHVDQFSQYRSLTAGPFSVFLEPRPTPPFANATMSFVAQVARSDTGAPLDRVPASILVAGPAGFSARKAMEPDGIGYHVASMVLPTRGNYSARIFITDDSTGETHATDTEFEVFPDIAYRIRPVDQAADLIVGQRATLAFEVVDPVTLQPRQLSDLKVRMEHWSEDHTQFRGAQEETPEQVGTGAWRIRPIVNATGMYHIRFASDAGGFNYDDVPLLHIYASPAPPDEKESPGAGTLGAILALVVVAVALRRR